MKGNTDLFQLHRSIMQNCAKRVYTAVCTGALFLNRIKHKKTKEKVLTLHKNINTYKLIQYIFVC